MWCAALIVSPIWLEKKGLLAVGMRYFFSFVCHQNPDRSFHILDQSMVVCARCTGIYLGSLIGILSFPFVAERLEKTYPWKKWLIVAVCLNLAESVLSILNLFTSLLFRAGAGMTLGFWTAFCVLFAIYRHNRTRLNWGDLS